MNYAIRITIPYNDCRDIIQEWAERSQSCIVYQHPADEEVPKTHVHLGLYGCTVKTEALKRMWVDCPGKGNEFWSWKEATADPTKYITYMSKGKFDPVWVKNISQETVQQSRQAWVEPVKADKPGDSTEHYIEQVLRRIDASACDTERKYQQLIDERSERLGFGPTESADHKLLDDCRSTAYKLLYARHRIAPPAQQYKQIASSAFLRKMEEWNRLDQGIHLIINLWK